MLYHNPNIPRSGAAGLGLSTTTYLARQGCKVYVASRNKEKSLAGIAEAQSRGIQGEILFHHLDLASIKDAKTSAPQFLEREERLDIVIANAGISAMPRDRLSVDGWERTFATNHLGHFAFINGLMGG